MTNHIFVNRIILFRKKHLQRNANCFRQGPFQTPGWDEALGAEEQDESKNVHDLRTKYCFRLAVLEPICFERFVFEKKQKMALGLAPPQQNTIQKPSPGARSQRAGKAGVGIRSQERGEPPGAATQDERKLENVFGKIGVFG